jgi:small subunit ribosomal protein S13
MHFCANAGFIAPMNLVKACNACKEGKKMSAKQETAEGKNAQPKIIAKADIKFDAKFEGKRIVRILATDIDGTIPLERALRKIKGIGFMFARSTCIAMNVDGRKKIGLMSEQEVKNVEEFIKNPKLPSWMLNRRKDPESGLDNHLTMSALDLRRREDINIMKRIRSYKGIRHESGQPVRGQRTRSTFRTQKSVGVAKKKAMPAKTKPPEGKK